jgi:Flp pilus assembly protein CpaB
MLAIASLLFLLLPFLLLTTSAQKLVGLHLQAKTTGSQVSTQTGEMEQVSVVMTPTTLKILARIEHTDVRASGFEEQEFPVAFGDSGADLQALQDRLRSLKTLSPLHNRISLQPSDDVPTQQLVMVMDAIRHDSQGELFPEVLLGRSP